MSAPEIQVSEFCDTGSGSTPSRAKIIEYYGGGIPWVKSGELREGTVTRTEESVTQSGVEAARLKVVPKGSILVAMYGATVGRTALLGIDATTNQAVCHVRPDPHRADTRYVWFALQAKMPELLSRRVGGAQPNISQETIKTTRIRLPSLPEQRRIADILDKADAIRRKRKESIALTESLLRSTFLEMFGDIPAKCSIWPFRPLRGFLSAASGKSSESVLSAQQTAIPVYGGNGVNGWATQALYDKPVVVVGRVGQQCGITRMTNGPAWVTDNAIVVSIKCPDVLDPVYLMMALQHSPLRSSVMRLDLPFINQSTILDYPLPFPPLVVQKRFAALRAQVLTAQTTLRTGHVDGEILFRSLTARAFSGQAIE